MAAAIALRHDWMADQVDAGIVARDEKSWRAVADAIRDTGKLNQFYE
jgi:hypothetical protein